jgi:hypothetical protein
MAQYLSDEEQADRIQKNASFIANGEAYVIKPDKYYRGQIDTDMSGGYGYKYNVETNSGVVTTHNLWHLGPVPEKFKEQLPDNARFVSDEYVREHYSRQQLRSQEQAVPAPAQEKSRSLTPGDSGSGFSY